MSHAQHDRIDQIVFTWMPRNLLDSGYGPVESSLSPEELQHWDYHLRDHLRGDELDRPATSLWHMPMEHRSVVLHRSRLGGIDNRKDIGHALIGPPDVLDVWTALRLSNWPGWRSAGATAGIEPATVPLRLDRLPDIRTGDELVEQISDWSELVSVLGAALRDPARPLTVVAGDVPPVPLLWGLFEIMRQFEQHLPAASTIRPSFSTYEEQGGRPGMPHVVFMRPGQTSGLAERTLVILDDQQVDDQAARVARRAVDEYAAGGVNQLAHWLDDSGALSPDADLQERLAILAGGRRPRVPEHAEQPHWRPEPRYEHAATYSPRVSPAEEAEPVTVHYAYAAASAGPSIAQRPPASPRSPGSVPRNGGNGSSRLRQTPDPRTMSWHELLHEVGHASTAERVREVLRAIGHRDVIEDRAERRAAAIMLAHNDFWVRRLWDLLGMPDLRKAVQLMFRSAFGPELAEGGHTWEFLGNMNLPASAVHPIVEYAIGEGLHDQLSPALGRRWMRENSWPVGEPSPQSHLTPVVPLKQKGWRGVVNSWTGGDTARALLTGVVAGASSVLLILAAIWAF